MTVDIKSDGVSDNEGVPKAVFAVIFYWGGTALAWKRRVPGSKWGFRDDFITAITNLSGLSEALVDAVNKQKNEVSP